MPAGRERAFILLILVSVVGKTLFASGEPDAFALTGLGARAGGMGNAFIGLSDEIETIYYNPAGLGNLVQSGVTAMYQTPSIQTSRGFFGVNQRWRSRTLPGSAGFGWLRLRSSDIELTNSSEQVTGTDNLTNDLFMFGAGIHPWEHWSMGATVKYFRFAFDGFSEGGFGADLGIHGQFRPFRFGVALTDLGGTMLKGSSIDPTQPEAHDKVPARLRPGAAVTLHDPFGLPLLMSLDVDALLKLQGAQDARIFSGLELWGFEGRGAFRTGFEQSVGPTLGFGARWGAFQLDYSYLLSLHLKDEHRISTTFRY